MTHATNGDTVRVHYTGKLDDGTQFDSSNDRSPLEFTLGQGQLIPGFEAAVLGMSPGDAKTVSIPAETAYGPHQSELVFVVDHQQFPETITPQVGQQLEVRQPDGGSIDVVVTDISGSNVTLDANSPLAGQDLTFDIELVEIV